MPHPPPQRIAVLERGQNSSAVALLAAAMARVIGLDQFAGIIIIYYYCTLLGCYYY